MYVMGMIEYIINRISSFDIAKTSTAWYTECVDDHGSNSIGYLLNLNCGHNNQYSSKEKDDLISLIRAACGDFV